MKANEYRLFCDTIETAVRRLPRKFSKAGNEAAARIFEEERNVALAVDLIVDEVAEAFTFEGDHQGCPRCE